MIKAIIQARMGSSRFTGKVLKEVVGKPLLQLMIERVQSSKLIEEIIIATTGEESDNPISDLASKLDVSLFRGSMNDVLDRYYKAARQYNAKVIVRLTADCPLVDPEVSDRVIQYYLDNQDRFDYVSNMHPPTFPDGLDTEVIPFEVLERAWEKAKKTYEREHVTPYIWDNPEIFRIGNVENDEELHLKERWTVDYEEDYIFIKQVYEHLYCSGKIFHMKDVLELQDRKPEIREINRKYNGMNWWANEWDNLKTKSTLRALKKQKR
jgi:spore coat polysaccharide biosynthesis protein SpsF